MKILIIEDNCSDAKSMADALESLGEVVVCTSPMPKMGEVIRMIGEADVVLLDHNLGFTACYKGLDLLPYCEDRDKKVIGISGQLNLGKIQFWGKESLAGNPSIVEGFKTLVAKVIAGE